MVIRTEVNHRTPRHHTMRTFEGYEYPGMIAVARIAEREGRTYVLVEMRAACTVEGSPPPGFSVPVEVSLENVAMQELSDALIERMRRR